MNDLKKKEYGNQIKMCVFYRFEEEKSTGAQTDVIPLPDGLS